MNGHLHHPTERFSDRVAAYVKYRPRYPEGVLDLLEENARLGPGSRIADVGSGTGLFAELLLRSGGQVFGIEPNREMREAGDEFLRAHPNFRSIDGAAEATGLPDHSIDLITAAQAFHWFEPRKTRREFARILKPGGIVALVWNDRRTDDTAFSRDYEDLICRFSGDYKAVNHKSNADKVAIQSFFTPGSVGNVEFENHQDFDFKGLKGRLLSSSYAPNTGHPDHLPMIEELGRVFDLHQIDGRVRVSYRTVVFWGELPETELGSASFDPPVDSN